MENNSTENLYLIDLSYAQSPADIVFELSTIIEQDSAQNQRVYLKLSNVDLNQSQLLSIKSLINSINSTLTLVSSESQQTELAAATLGILISENLIEPDNSSSVAEPETPAAQYVAMTDHLEEVFVEQEDDVQDMVEETSQAEPNEVEEEIAEEECVDEIPDEVSEKNIEETTPEPIEEVEISEDKDIEKVEETQVNKSDNEQIQAELDSIFDSEMKLENFFGKDILNAPIAQEGYTIDTPEEELTEEDYAIRKMPSKYIKQTVRSGQVVKAEGNLIIIGDCHPGSEVHAQGDITVWGALGGIAHAGSEGNKKARIRALQLNAIQIRIGESFARRPDASNVVYIEKNNTVTPEEARIINDSIVILKLND